MQKMEEIRAQMSTIEDPRHPSYVKYASADILIIIMCGVLCGLDTLGDLMVYAKSKADFLKETFGIEKIPSKATFGRILSFERLCDRQRHHIGTGSHLRKDKRDSRFSRNAHIFGCREQSCYSGRHALPAGDIPQDRAEEGGLSVRIEGKSTVLAGGRSLVL